MVENIDKWRKAGRIACEAIEFARSLIKPGVGILEVAEKVDQKVVDLGARPAWPVQISRNHVAAHWTPEPDDDQLFTENDVVKVDVGTHIDGIVGDNALTVDLTGKYADLVKAAEEALSAAHKALGVGVPVNDVGEAIQEVIEGHGFVPIRNLSGHTISEWVIHDRPSVPNFANGDMTELKDGQIIAIEPFSTNGSGFVVESEQANLFALLQKKPVRSPFAREVLKHIEDEYGAFPFTTRWLSKKFGLGKTRLALKELNNAGMLRAYPPLVERDKGVVAQREWTFLIGERVEVLTK